MKRISTTPADPVIEAAIAACLEEIGADVTRDNFDTLPNFTGQVIAKLREKGLQFPDREIQVNMFGAG